MGDPRTPAINASSSDSVSDGSSWYGLVGSQTQAVDVAPSQYSSRPSKVSASSCVRRTGVQPGNSGAGRLQRKTADPERRAGPGAFVLTAALIPITAL